MDANLDLKHCPFCGAPAEPPVNIAAATQKPLWEVHCKLRCISMRRRTEKAVVADWNRRHTALQETDPIEQIQAGTEPKKYLRVERHIPGFFSDVPHDDRVVTSIEEMYALPYLRAWENEPTFKRWECYTEGTEPRLLMAVMKDGKFWVAAYVWGDKLESLPRWKAP